MYRKGWHDDYSERQYFIFNINNIILYYILYIYNRGNQEITYFPENVYCWEPIYHLTRATKILEIVDKKTTQVFGSLK